MVRLLIAIISWSLVPKLARLVLLRAWGADIRTRGISSGCFFGSSKLSIGAGSYINVGCFFDGLEQITIGEQCHFGMEVMLITSTHTLGPTSCRAGALTASPVTIGDGCWLGARSIVQPGVTIGDGCVIAPGAVVTEDCAPNGFYAGIPATRKRTLP